MEIRHGFFLEDSYTGVRGRVLALPTDKSGDFVVQTRRGIDKVQGFNAVTLSYIQPQLNDVVNVTNGTANFTGAILSDLDNDEYEMELAGVAGTVKVHTSQMYQIVARAQQAVA